MTAVAVRHSSSLGSHTAVWWAVRAAACMLAVMVGTSLTGFWGAPAAADPDINDATMARFYDPVSGDHFYTTSTFEAQAVAASTYVSEAALGCTPTVPNSATTALYRFYDPATGTHFYTASQYEADIVTGQGIYRAEGVAANVYTTPADGRVAVHRFLDTAAGTHLYTTSDFETAEAQARAGYIDEGTAYYVGACARQAS